MTQKADFSSWSASCPNLFSALGRGLGRSGSEEALFDRQSRIEGYDQKALRGAFVWVFGCNGLGRTLSEFLVRKGLGRIGLCDPDFVEPSNLHRTLWSKESLGEYKVLAAQEELAESAPARCEIAAYIGTLQEVLANDRLMQGVASLE